MFYWLSFCARGTRKNCKGDVSPTDAGGIIRKLETLTTDCRHVDIGGLTRR